MDRIADIHCHILPYVDDGAENQMEAVDLLDEQIRQGVHAICITPHLREGMFETSDEQVQNNFDQLKEIAASKYENIQLVLSREYYCNDEFLGLLEKKQVIPLGNGNTLLVEFSNRFSYETICQRIRFICEHEYTPLVAHVERYEAIGRKTERIRKLIRQGALIQVNAGSILGREGIWQKRFCYKLMKENLVHVVASDAHGCEFRPPELRLCADYIGKKFGASYMKNVMWEYPMNILRLL